jgi:hypothetical protein
MTIKPYLAVALFLGYIPVTTAQATAPAATDEGHVSTTMTFVVKAPMQKAAPLFTPTGMQCWLGSHFQPEIVHAQLVKDTAGAVFTMQQGPQKSVWVNTLLDVKDGRMQYAMFVPDTMVTIVEVRMISDGKDATRVELTHTMTALSADARAALKSMGTQSQEHIAAAQKAIEGCLAADGGVRQ